MRRQGESSGNGRADSARSVAAFLRRRLAGERDDGYVSWRDADLSVRQPRGRRWMVRALAYATVLTGSWCS